MGRHGFTVALWVVTALIVGLLAVQGIPWLWPRLFPRPGEGLTEAVEVAGTEAPSVQEVGEVVDRLVASWGAELGGPEEPLSLPRGRSPRELQDALRGVDALGTTTLYVTDTGPFTHRLRVFHGADLLLLRDLRRWMPDRPAVRADNPPELGIVFRFVADEPATFGRVLKWKSPMAVALPPFGPESLRAAGKAVKAGKDVIVEVDPTQDIAEQVAALPGVTGVLVTAPFVDAAGEATLIASLDRRDLFLLDGRPEGEADVDAGPLRLERAAHLDGPEAGVFGRNLAVRWGHAIITVDAAGDGPQLAEEFIEIAKEDGYLVRLPVEVAREHGRPPD